MASKNIFAATTTPSKRSASDIKREVVGNCIVPACNGADVTRHSPTFGGCSNFEKSGCKFKISILTAPSVCITCHGSINPGVKCLGVPHPTAERGPTGRVVYINNHLEWDQCLGARIAVRGKDVCKFVEPTEEGDERVEKPCERCSEFIAVGDFIISAWRSVTTPLLPRATPFTPSSAPGRCLTTTSTNLLTPCSSRGSRTKQSTPPPSTSTFEIHPSHRNPFYPRPRSRVIPTRTRTVAGSRPRGLHSRFIVVSRRVRRVPTLSASILFGGRVFLARRFPC
ncbi:unnamed protein product [Pylaiella littoralis]